MIGLVVGCVAVQKDGAVAPVQAAEVDAAQVALPNNDLTAEVLYPILVAEVAAQRGQFGIAAEQYLTIARTTRDPRIAERATQLALFTRDKQKLLEPLRTWVEIDPDNLQARQSLVSSLLSNKQPDDALEHLEKLLASDIKQPKAALSVETEAEFATGQGANFMMIAALLDGEEDKQAALKLMQKFAARHQGNPDASLAYSNLALSLGDFKVALEQSEQALQLKPAWPNALVLRARALYAQRETTAALAGLEQALREKPKDLTVRLGYARMLSDAKRTDEARAQFKIMAEQVPDNADILLAMGLLSLQINQTDDAEVYFTQVGKLDKYPQETHYYLGQIAEFRKQYGPAIEWYKGVTEGQAYLDAQLRIVALLAKQKDIPAARAHLQGIQVESQQQAKLLLLTEADLLREEKQYEQALEIYNAALAETPGETNLLYARAMLAEKMDKLDILEQDLRSILQREPDNAQALNALGYTLADRTTRYQEALGYIERAFKLQPEDPAVLDSMGWVHYRLGNSKEAVYFLKRALQLSSEAEIAAHLGEVLWAAGERQAAREVWGQALKTDTQDPILLDTVERFDR